MKKHNSYTYLIGWSQLNEWYYGVRFHKKCRPDDLWKTYFTSSKIVKEYRKLYGEPDVVTVRKTFNDIDKARNWEHNVLRKMKVVESDKWLNQCDQISIRLDGLTIKKTGAILSEKYKGTGNPFYGKTHTDEVKQKLREKALQRDIPEHVKNSLRTRWVGKKRTSVDIENKRAYAKSRFFIVNKEGTVRHCFDTMDERLTSGEFIRGRTWKD